MIESPTDFLDIHSSLQYSQPESVNLKAFLVILVYENLFIVQIIKVLFWTRIQSSSPSVPISLTFTTHFDILNPKQSI